MVFCHPVANCFHRCRPDPPAETPGGSRVDADTASGTAPGADNKEDTTKGEEGEDDSHSKTNGGESEKNEKDSEPSANSTSELAIKANGGKQSERESEKDKAPSSGNGTAPLLSLADPATVESAKSSNGDENVPGEYAYVSSFIMGLSFQKGSRFIDIEPPIKVCTMLRPYLCFCL